MKKIICLILLIALATSHAVAQAWEYVGSPGFSAGWELETSIAIDGSGIPYVAYVDGANGYKATVMKFITGNWVAVGVPGFSEGSVDYLSIALDAMGNPYIAYQDLAHGYKAIVMKYDGSSWVQLGGPGFSVYGVDFTSIALDNLGNPYVAYSDSYNGYKATVMKYDGSSWVALGHPGFSAGVAQYTSIAIDTANNVYVAYEDDSNDAALTVMKYTDTSWVAVGSPGISGSSDCVNISMAIDKPGTPYVIYSYLGGPCCGPAVVLKYADSNWVTVGGHPLPGSAVYSSICIDKNGNPYVVFSNGVGPAVVEQYEGSSWVYLGGYSMTPGPAAYTSIAIDSNSIPYVAFEDSAYGKRASVMRFGPLSGVSNIKNKQQEAFSIYPNPAQKELTISSSQKVKAAIISNVLGQVVLSKLCNANNVAVDVSELPAGVYFVKVNNTELRKFVKE